MEQEFKRIFGVQEIIWLKDGPVDDTWYMDPRVHGNVFCQAPVVMWTSSAVS
ncbi:MAG: hypothetical protein IPL86_15775 [Flavobacteriales bacterium]|nr:hypothetical protein [Flavobacteriales bacterium]